MRYNDLDVTPTQIAKELLELSRELAEAVKDLDELELNVVAADEAYFLAESEWILKANERDELRNNDTRKAWVAPRVTTERVAAATAKAIVRARYKRVDTIKSRITVGQTACNALQSELDLQRVRSR